jgi:cold shock CspA family protein
MDVKPHIVFEGIEPLDRIRDQVRAELDKLERFGRIISCRVVVAKPQNRHRHGDLFHVAVHLTLPEGREVHADRNPSKDHSHEDFNVALRDAFTAARRQLQSAARKMRGDVKHHEEAPQGTVKAIFEDEDHGFIGTLDGREVYFHRHAVANGDFDRLHVGDRVRFSESNGEQGPQASFVQPL